MTLAVQSEKSRVGIQQLSFDEIESVSGGFTGEGIATGIGAASGALLGAFQGAKIGASYGFAVSGPVGLIAGGVLGGIFGYSVYHVANQIADSNL